MTYASNWSHQARADMCALSEKDRRAVRAAVSVIRGRMPEADGVTPVEGTKLEVAYEIQPRKILGVRFVRTRIE